MDRKHTLKLSAAGLALVGLLGTVPAVIPAQAAPTASQGVGQVQQTTQAVTGTLNGVPFAGQLSNLTVKIVEGVLTLTGTLTGNGLAGPLNFSTPLDPSQVQANCDILNLNLGPLDLDVLGLTVHLDPVILDVAAQPGPGKLLGNLLCSVAHLLDNGGPLTGISALLNRLLTGLGL